MKKICYFSPLILSVIWGSSALAAGTDPNEVIRQAQNINDKIAKKASNLSGQTLRSVSALLDRIESHLEGHGVAGNREVCERDEPSALGLARKEVEDFAYSTAGLNMDREKSAAFASEWTTKYPCSFSAVYKTTAKSIEKYAYDMKGLNMSSGDALAYAAQRSMSLCYRTGNYLPKFKEWYDYAYSMSGLNYSSQKAVAYAKARMEDKYFSCRHLRD